MLYVTPRGNGDPACWRPAWGGVRLCGNDWWERVIFGGLCRFAQDDTWGTGARDEKQNAVSVSLTELYFQPSKLRTLFRLTPRVILSEAAHRV